MMLLAISLGVVLCVAGAVWAARRGMTQSQSLTGAYRRLYNEAPAPLAHQQRWEAPLATAARSLAQSNIGDSYGERYRYELAVADVGVPAVMLRVISTALVGFVAAAIGLWVLPLVTQGLIELAFPLPVLVVLPFGVAALMGWYQLSNIQASLRRQYADFNAGIGHYISLVSVCLTTRRTAAEAVTYAADIGSSRTFEVIARAVHAAPAMGRPAHEALLDVGETYGSIALQDMATSIANVATVGVGVERTVQATAARVRQVDLDTLTRQADTQTSTMFAPLMLAVLGVVAFLGYPLVQRVLDAFSQSPTT